MVELYGWIVVDDEEHETVAWFDSKAEAVNYHRNGVTKGKASHIESAKISYDTEKATMPGLKYS